MAFKDTFEERWPRNFWDAVGNILWPLVYVGPQPQAG
jgi:hypothetical protein